MSSTPTSFRLDNFLGQEIPKDFLDALKIDSRVSYPLKPTTDPGISSTSADQQDPSTITSGDDLKSLISHVKDMEDRTKLLEDMRDDMLKDMNIPPTSSSISDAALALNGNGNPNITYSTFKKAENIINTFPIMQLGFDPVLLALTGDGTIDGNFLQCSQVTPDTIDSWKVGANSSSATTPDNINSTPQTGVQKAKEDFKKKMTDMLSYMIKMLWWEIIYARCVILIFTIVESLIATPIDSIFCLLRFAAPNSGNRNKYGPITKLLNKLKIIMLCKWPKSAFKDYNPDESIIVNLKLRGDNSPKPYSLKQLCSTNFGIAECPVGTTTDSHISQTTGSNIGHNIDDISSAMGDIPGDDDCVSTDFMNNPIDTPQQKLGISPKCAENAMTIMTAVYDDSLSYSEYQSATTGDLSSLGKTL